MRTLLAALLLLSGCATSNPIYLPDGSSGYTVNCDGSASSWSVCFQAASGLCGSAGYDVLERSDDKTGTAVVTPQWGTAGAMVSRSMLVRCKSVAESGNSAAASDGRAAK